MIKISWKMDGRPFVHCTCGHRFIGLGMSYFECGNCGRTQSRAEAFAQYVETKSKLQSYLTPKCGGRAMRSNLPNNLATKLAIALASDSPIHNGRITGLDEVLSQLELPAEVILTFLTGRSIPGRRELRRICHGINAIALKNGANLPLIEEGMFDDEFNVYEFVDTLFQNQMSNSPVDQATEVMTVLRGSYLAGDRQEVGSVGEVSESNERQKIATG